jgi:hypothetical protein
MKWLESSLSKQAIPIAVYERALCGKADMPARGNCNSIPETWVIIYDLYLNLSISRLVSVDHRSLYHHETRHEARHFSSRQVGIIPVTMSEKGDVGMAYIKGRS